MAFSRAFCLSSERMMVQGAIVVCVLLSISYLRSVKSSQCSWACMSISLSFQFRSGSSRLRSKRRCCSFLVTEK